MQNTAPVLTGPQKAVVSAIVAVLGTVGTAIVTVLPGNDTIQYVVAGVGAVVTALASYVGVYTTTNKQIR